MTAYQILITGALQKFLIQLLCLIKAHFKGLLYGTNEIISHGLQYWLFLAIGCISIYE